MIIIDKIDMKRRYVGRIGLASSVIAFCVLLLLNASLEVEIVPVNKFLNFVLGGGIGVWIGMQFRVSRWWFQ